MKGLIIFIVLFCSAVNGGMIAVNEDFNNVELVNIACDNQGRVHLVYCVFDPLELTTNSELFNVQSVRHIVYDQGEWRQPKVITTDCSNFLIYPDLFIDNRNVIHFVFQKGVGGESVLPKINTFHYIYENDSWKKLGTLWENSADSSESPVYESKRGRLVLTQLNEDSLILFNTLCKNNHHTHASFVFDLETRSWGDYRETPFRYNYGSGNSLYSVNSFYDYNYEIFFAYSHEKEDYKEVSLGEDNSRKKNYYSLISKGPEQLHLFWTEDLIELEPMDSRIVCPLIRHALSYDKGRSWDFIGDTVFYDPLEFGDSGEPFWEGAWDIHPFLNSEDQLFVVFKYIDFQKSSYIYYVYSWNEDTFQWEKRYEVSPGLSSGVIDCAFFDDTIYIYTRSKISSGINGGDDYSMGMIHTVDVSPPKLAGSREASTDGAVAELSLFPNPGKDRLSLRLSWDEEEKIKVRVFNLMGRTVYETYTAKREVTVNCSSWASGCYLVCVEGKDRQVRGKWMKVK